MWANVITPIIEYFIPEDLLDDNFSRGFSIIYITVCIFTALLSVVSVFFLSFSPLTPDQLHNVYIIAGLTILAYVIGLYVLRSGGHLVVAINLYSVTIYINIITIVCITGGFSESPQVILLLFIPLWSFVMLDYIYGVLASVAVAIAVITLCVLEVQGVEFPQYILLGTQPYMRLQAWIGLLVIITCCLYVYAHNFNALNERLNAERSRLAYQAVHDPLTGLSNRTLFYKRARAAIEHIVDGQLKMGIIYIDVDEFKPINDELGHEVGDKVLVIIGQRLKEAVRSSDTVSRLGGDEFGIVLHGLANKDAAQVIAEKIVRSIARPIATQGHELKVGASLGIVVSSNNGIKVDDLVRQADNAMYKAKRNQESICFA